MGIKKLVRKILYLVFSHMGRKNVVIFESVPDFSDNTKAVFDEMVRQGLDKENKLVWYTQTETRLETHHDIGYLCSNKKNFWEKIRIAWYMANAKCMICCNRWLIPVVPSTTSIYLTHGTPFKSVRHYYNMPESIHYCLAASPYVAEMFAYEIKADKNKMFSLGYPRNDVFAQPPIDVKSILQTKCDKVIVWYPTFRQAKNGRMAGGEHALPIIHDGQIAQEINDFAEQHNVLIVVKPHFAQDTRVIEDLNLTNIKFINDDFFVENHITSYEFVGGCDALISDYSSIYYDFTLCNKPIALIWEDLEEYRKEPGFAVDLDVYAKGAAKVYTPEEMKQFIYDVSVGRDIYKTEREEIRDLVNYSTDGKNAERVVAFIREKAGL